MFKEEEEEVDAARRLPSIRILFSAADQIPIDCGDSLALVAQLLRINRLRALCRKISS